MAATRKFGESFIEITGPLSFSLKIALYMSICYTQTQSTVCNEKAVTGNQLITLACIANVIEVNAEYGNMLKAVCPYHTQAAQGYQANLKDKAAVRSFEIPRQTPQR